MEQSNPKFPALASFLGSLPPGEVTDAETISNLERLLSAAWELFDGNDDSRMAGYKLHGRMENVAWAPPQLNFQIARHGAMVGGGSSRADLYHWTIDTSNLTATSGKVSYRQVYPAAPRLNVAPLVAQTVALIESGERHPWIVWKEQKVQFRLDIGKIIPSIGYKQTATGRRKRFAAKLEEAIGPKGWVRVDAGSHYIYRRSLT